MELEELINKYNNYLHTVVNNFSYNRLSEEDIEEIIADTFFIFWKNENKIDFSKKINLYLAGIAKNLVKEKFRKQKDIVDLEDFENEIVDNTDILFDYEQVERQKIIEKSLDNMPKEDKTIFILYYYSSNTIKEIAQKLNFSEFKVKSKLFRIRKKIKFNLERGGYRYE